MTSTVNTGHCGIENEAFDGNNNEGVIENVVNQTSRDTDAVVGVKCDVIRTSPTAESEARHEDHTVVNVCPNQYRNSADSPYGCFTLESSPGDVDAAVIAGGVVVTRKDVMGDGNDELDICEVDYESNQMCDNDDVDDEESCQEASAVTNIAISTDDDGDVIATTHATTFSRQRCWPFSRCGAKVRHNCSKFCHAARVELDDVKEQIVGGFPRPSCNRCCTVEKLGKRLPIIRWLPKYR
jgi:hypothetical protein